MSLMFLLVLFITMLQVLKVFNAVEIHILKLLKVNCSNSVCSLSMQLIFQKQSQYDN